jgi:polyferredoxin
MKIPSRFSIFKYKVDNNKCTKCRACEKICPMDIKILDYAAQNKRILSTECILCGECSSVCPSKSISITRGFDRSAEEYVKYRDCSKSTVD